MSGSSAVMQLDGWTWEDMTVRAVAGIHVRWPRTTPLREFLSVDPENIDQKKRDASIESIKQALRRRAGLPGRQEGRQSRQAGRRSMPAGRR